MSKMEWRKRKLQNKSVNHVRILVPLFFFLVIVLSGCSLAVPDGAGAHSKDTLLGVMLTTDSIDKTYADVTWAEEGIEKIEFGILNGPFVLFDIWSDEKNGPVCDVEASQGIDYTMHINVQDLEEEYQLKVNAYLLRTKEKEELTFYMNPIYMDSENRIYVVAGERATFSGGFDDGGTLGYGFNEKETFQFHDTKIETNIVINITASLADEPTNICFTQMDPDKKILKKDVFPPRQVPKEMFVDEETECVIVATEQKGKVAIDREACYWDGETTYVSESGEDKTSKERNATLYHTFYPDSSGFLLKQDTWVIWPE